MSAFPTPDRLGAPRPPDPADEADEIPSMPVTARAGWKSLLTAVNPLVGRDLQEFGDATREFAQAPAVPATVAVVGMTPGEGRSTVAAALALTIAAYSTQRVLVIDGGGSSPSSVTSLLGGDPRQGRLSVLAQTSAPVVARSRIRQAATPRTAVPVLGLAGGEPIGPQLLQSVLRQLRHRADVVIVDCPAVPISPLASEAVTGCEHTLLVARGDGDTDRRLAAALGFLGQAGHNRNRTASAVVVSRGWSTPVFTEPPLGVTILPRDEGLRTRALDRMAVPALSAALAVATDIRHARWQARDAH